MKILMIQFFLQSSTVGNINECETYNREDESRSILQYSGKGLNKDPENSTCPEIDVKILQTPIHSRMVGIRPSLLQMPRPKRGSTTSRYSLYSGDESHFRNKKANDNVESFHSFSSDWKRFLIPLIHGMIFAFLLMVMVHQIGVKGNVQLLKSYTSSPPRNYEMGRKIVLETIKSKLLPDIYEHMYDENKQIEKPIALESNDTSKKYSF